jgi:hypothetical protein
LETYEFLRTAMGLDGLAGLRLLIEQAMSPNSALCYFDGFDQLPADIPDGSLYLGVEQTVARLRAELTAVKAWTDDESEEKLANVRHSREAYNAEEATRLAERLAAVSRILSLVIRWHPQLDDLEALERAEIMRAGLIARLVEMRDWATRVYTDVRGNGSDDLPETGAAYREAEIVRLRDLITETMARTTTLYGEYRSQLPVLLDLRRFLAEAVEPTA